jgi:hypothetical protein
MYHSRIFLVEWRSNTKSVSVGSLLAERYVACFVCLDGLIWRHTIQYLLMRNEVDAGIFELQTVVLLRH